MNAASWCTTSVSASPAGSKRGAGGARCRTALTSMTSAFTTAHPCRERLSTSAAPSLRARAAMSRCAPSFASPKPRQRKRRSLDLAAAGRDLRHPPLHSRNDCARFRLRRCGHRLRAGAHARSERAVHATWLRRLRRAPRTLRRPQRSRRCATRCCRPPRRSHRALT